MSCCRSVWLEIFTAETEHFNAKQAIAAVLCCSFHCRWYAGAAVMMTATAIVAVDATFVSWHHPH